MIIKELFRVKARFLIFHRIPLLLLESRILYTALNILWMKNWKIKKPLVVTLPILKVILKRLTKIELLKTLLRSFTELIQCLKRACFFQLQRLCLLLWSYHQNLIYIEINFYVLNRQLKSFNSSLKWLRCIWFQHRISFNWIHNDTRINISLCV